MSRNDDAPHPGTCVQAADYRSARHLNQPQLADRWHLSQRTLERWRCLGGGPPFLKINGRILYRLVDVEAFEAAQVRMPAGRRKREQNTRGTPDDTST